MLAETVSNILIRDFIYVLLSRLIVRCADVESI